MENKPQASFRGRTPTAIRMVTRQLASAFRGRTVPAILMMAGLLVSVYIFGEMGVQDVSGALTYGGRLCGAFLLAVALFALAAFVVVLDQFVHRLTARGGGTRQSRNPQPTDHQRTVIMTSLLGVIAVALANLLLLFVQFGEGEYTPWAWVWFILFLWCLWAFYDLHRWGAWNEIGDHRRGSFTVLASITAIAAVANAVYSDVYGPYASPVTVQTSTEFGKPAITKNTVYLPLTIGLENTGKMGAHVVGSVYRVLGLKWDSIYDNPKRLPQWEKDLDDASQSGDWIIGTPLNAFEENRQSTVISHGLIATPGGYWLDPGEKKFEQRIIELPAGVFRTVQAMSRSVLIRKDRVIMDGNLKSWNPQYSWGKNTKPVWAPGWVTQMVSAPPNSDYIRFDTSIKYGSMVSTRTRRDRSVTLWWLLGTADQPTSNLTGIVAPKGSEGNPPGDLTEVLREHDRYGYVYLVSGSAEMPLTP